MARRKRDSKVLAILHQRIAGLQSIRTNLDLGGGVSVAALSKLHQALNDALVVYNRLLSDADAALNSIQELETNGRQLAERTLTGIATKYGKDSSEYEQAGGTRRSERKKPGTSAAAKAKAKAAQAEAKAAQAEAV